MTGGGIDDVVSKADEYGTRLTPGELRTLVGAIRRDSPSVTPVDRIAALGSVVGEQPETLESTDLVRPAVDALEVALGSDDRERRVEAARAVSRFGRAVAPSDHRPSGGELTPSADTVRDALSAVRDALATEDDPEVRGALITAVGELGRTGETEALDAIAGLISLVNSPVDDRDPQRALGQLEAVGGEHPAVAANPLVVSSLSPLYDRPTERATDTPRTADATVDAIEVLGHVARAAPELVAPELDGVAGYLRSGEWYQREAAAEAFEVLAEEAPGDVEPFVPVLGEALADDSDLVRLRAATALEHVGNHDGGALDPVRDRLVALRDGTAPETEPAPQTRIALGAHSRRDPATAAADALSAADATQVYSDDGGPIVLRCPDCGREPDDDADHCVDCGRELASHCPDCDTEVDDDAGYCPACGTDLGRRP